VEVIENRETGKQEIWLDLDRKSGRYVCSGCGRSCLRYHDCEFREVRELPILGVNVWLGLWRFRAECPRCGPRLEKLEWLEPKARLTQRFSQAVAKLCKLLPISDVATHFALDWHTVKAIDKMNLQKTLDPPDFSGVRVLLMDEFALRRGHRYATVVYDAETGRVLWVGKGRRQVDVRPFFQLLGPEGCSRIQAVGMDMSAAFEAEVRSQCLQAKIVYDLFHVVAKFGQEVVDPVRRDEVRRLSGDPEARKVMKGARWLLLRNPQNLPNEASRIRLRELLGANEALMTVYVLKEDLKQLWTYKREAWARKAWEDWMARAMESGLVPLKRFARNLAKRLEGILAHCLWPLNTSRLEGVNNRIKVIKRMAYGFRDDAYFFLKIRSAFPGITR
jgi:transposase